MYKYYKVVRGKNPEIKAIRVLEYIRALKKEGNLKKAFGGR